jgi:hypothetical protein
MINERFRSVLITTGSLWSSVLLCGCLGVAGIAGYICGAFRQADYTHLSVQQRVPVDFYLSERSFSEIENARARLEALGSEFLTDVRLRHDASVLGRGVPFRGNPSYAVQPDGAIEELQKGIAQLKGDGQETPLVRELLTVLNKQKRPDQWLDVFLTYLYEHPTDPLVGKCAKHAAVLSQALGREGELADAFDFVGRIPAKFHAPEPLVTTIGQGLFGEGQATRAGGS